MTEKLTAFFCGKPRDHVCDDNGPATYGLIDGRTTTSYEEAIKEGHTWGSVTCSVCGRTAMDNSMWSDW